jgi:hypothetical protein
MKEGVSAFVSNLHTILECEDPSIIAWTNNSSFIIVDPDRLSMEVMGKYFRHTKVSSFMRQVNFYGFKKINQGEDTGAYYHPLFKRGALELLKFIK